MEERQLRRFGFFRWVGCFAIDRDRPRRALASLRLAAELLVERPGRALIIFPQGRIVPNDRRPLELETGLVRLIELALPVEVIPVALRYEYRREQHPLALIGLGRPIAIETAPDRRALLAELTRALTEEMDRLRRQLLADELDRCQSLLRGRASISDLGPRLARLGAGLLPRRR
jgi:1-acyl-sn-glycerol-3-phosphate acyltransferase